MVEQEAMRYQPYSKKHLKIAEEEPAHRFSTAWTRFYHPELKEFVPKTQFKRGGKTYYGTTEYLKFMKSGDIPVPEGYVYNLKTDKLNRKDTLSKAEVKKQEVLFQEHTVREKYPELVEPFLSDINPDEGFSLPRKGIVTIEIEGYGMYSMEFKVKETNRKFKTIESGGVEVDMELRATEDFNVDVKELRDWNYLPFPGAVYYSGSDDFVKIIKLAGLELRESAIDIIYINNVNAVPGRAPIPMEQIRLGLSDVAQVLAHPFIFTQFKKDTTGEQMEIHHNAPETNNDCVLQAIKAQLLPGFEKINRGREMSMENLATLLGCKDGDLRVSVDQIIPLFEKYRLRLTVMDRAGKVIKRFDPDEIGRERNKKLTGIHLYIVAHNEHAYRWDYNQTSFCHKKYKLTDEEEDTECAELPSTYLTKPNQTTFDGYVDNLEQLEEKLTDGCTNPSRRIAYRGDIEDLFVALREKHSYEPEVRVSRNSVDGLVMYNKVDGKQDQKISVMKMYSDADESFNEWMNTFKKVVFNDSYKSQYSPGIQHAFTALRKTQLVKSFGDSPPFGAQQVDIRRAYTASILAVDKIPVLMFTDTFVEYKGEPIEDYSLYLVANKKYTPERYLIANKSQSVVSGFVLKRSGIDFQIEYVMKPSHLMDNPFKRLVKALYMSGASEFTKKFVPHYVLGMCSRMWNQTEKGWFTTSFDEAMHLANGERSRILNKPALGGYIGMDQSQSVLMSEGMYMFQFFAFDVLRLKMLQLYRQLINEGISVYGIRVDALYVDRKPTTIKFVNGDCDFNGIGSCSWVPTHKCVPFTRASIQLVDNVDFNKPASFKSVDVIETNNTFVKGIVAGAGKTYASLTNRDKETTLVVVPSNAQCERIENEYGMRAITIAKLLGQRVIIDGVIETNNTFDINPFKVIVFDELLQNSMKTIGRILQFMVQHNDIQYIANGDIFQNSNGDDCNNVHRRTYLDQVLPQFFPEALSLETSWRTIHEEREMHEELRKDLMNGFMTREQIIKKYKFNTFSNLKEMSDRGVHQAITLSNITAHCVNMTIDNTVRIGSRMVLKTYCSSLVMNKQYVVQAVDNTRLMVEGKWYARNKFRLPYSITCHSCQGDTIENEYMIFDVFSPHATNEWFYTAVTRCRSFKQVWIALTKFSHVSSNIAKKITKYKQQDISAGREVDDFVDFEYVSNLLKTSNYCCAHCHEFVDVEYADDDRYQWTLDRIDNDSGHVKGNVQIAHLACNVAMAHEAKGKSIRAVE